jgi:hypothetical protein
MGRESLINKAAPLYGLEDLLVLGGDDVPGEVLGDIVRAAPAEFVAEFRISS